jgi:hypothetical protein
MEKVGKRKTKKKWAEYSASEQRPNILFSRVMPSSVTSPHRSLIGCVARRRAASAVPAKSNRSAPARGWLFKRKKANFLSYGVLCLKAGNTGVCYPEMRDCFMQVFSL